jgi:hypothetical protein
MLPEAVLSALTTNAAQSDLKATLLALQAKNSKERRSEKQHRLRLSIAIRELLKENPDLSLAEANIHAAEATGVPPSPLLVRIKDILGRIKRHETKQGAKNLAERAKKKSVKRTAK